MSTSPITPDARPPVAEREGPPWGPITAGAVIVAVIVIAIIIATRQESPQHASVDPYAANLQFSDLKMSTSENFAGGTVTYLDGKLTNNGDKTVIGVETEIVFKNALGEIVQKEDVPARVLQTTGPYPDTATLKSAPLRPHDSRPIRFTFEHISDDWNRALPDIKIVHAIQQ
jgi:hypothetical protein